MSHSFYNRTNFPESPYSGRKHHKPWYTVSNEENTNKVPNIRACLCHDTYSAHQGVEHDNMNILCLGARVIGIEMATELVKAFLSAGFSGETRHRRRLEKVMAIERQAL